MEDMKIPYKLYQVKEDMKIPYKLYQVMEDMKIPYKLIRLVQMTMKNTTARVKVTNKLSNSFTFNAGVRQGDGLSTTVYSGTALWSPEDRSERYNFHKT
jgi:hypothetical protein